MSSSVVNIVSTYTSLLALTLRTGDGIIERLLGEMASLVGSVQDLIVEHGEVEGKTKTDGVSGRKLGLGNLGGSLVGVEGLVGGILALVANGELGEVTMVVTLPVRLLEAYKSRESRGTNILW